ncbi:small G protein signaling modulator 2-like [Thrips palmi]|uniref:Small G protein signaling modulator 2-like n=1 Tax=Thrips palmi TaxID=161013 RepID=A0A6P8YKM2_THRPL|nr:small G protein signaling modulator 2-like [Thrips palmi]
MGDASPDKNFKKKLIDNVKKEVKQIMEEAVTKKFVHEDSSSVTSLCAAVEACLSQGLRRRALGLFKTSSTTALLHKVAKNFAPAEVVSRRVQEIENSDPTRTNANGRKPRSSSSGDSTSRPAKPPLQKKNSSGAVLASPRYLWIRLALFEKHLAKIIDHLVQNSTKYYEKDSLVADPDYGSILSSLLVGPCALDFSRTKTQDHYWTDPPADELVQRHRISSGHNTPPAGRRPALHFRRSMHGVSSEESLRQAPKDYVESLHQNNRATLLYGKNNVLVMPQKDMPEPMPGYLSLHQTFHSLTIKWTPNQLMNGYSEAEDKDKSIYWDYAMNVKVDEIVYVHCHQQGDNGGTVVLVGQDGVQRPPIHFPKGGHLLAFLSCLETGLLPRGQLDPPLWSQRGKVAELREEQEEREREGKVFPKLHRRGRNQPTTRLEDSDESTDYVFRIVSKSSHEDFLAGQDLLEPRSWTDAVGQALGQGASQARGRVRAALASTSTASSTSSSKSLSLEPGGVILAASQGSQGSQASQDLPHAPKLTTGDSIQLVCDTMKRQLISRAFYGWLAYCRHLRTVRTHLSGLVATAIVSPDEPCDARAGVTKERWAELGCREELFRLAYFGGVCHDIRKQVWPYLLGHYVFGSTAEDRRALDATTRQNYETTMSEWLAVEAIVRQRDKETMAANLAKLSSESTSGEAPPPTPNLQHDLSNDVFEDNVSLSDDDNDPVVVDGEDGAEQNDTSDAPEAVSTAAAAAATVAVAPTGAEMTSAAAVVAAAGAAAATTTATAAAVAAEAPTAGVVEGETAAVQNGEVEEAEAETVPEAQAETAAPEPEAEPDATEPGEAKQNGAEEPAEGVPETEAEKAEQADQGEELTEAANLAAEARDSAEAPLKNNYAAANAKIVMTKPSVDAVPETEKPEDSANKLAGTSQGQGNRSNCVSPASSQGGVYSTELLETFGLNVHRIDKDVQRCDRNYWYFTVDNLEKLRNVMCTYVWEHLDIGYMQGMCDLVAPLLVILDDESSTYACFCRLMDRMGANFPNGGAMDTHFANMRSLIQILDSEMFELMHQNGDYTHFYFCYRWFLLDFKRELLYDDVFSTWETIWAAQHVASSNFVLFIALALVQTYRDIILSNSMDFTDIIKFFNEMAERHDAKAVLALARDLVLQLQTLIENK